MTVTRLIRFLAALVAVAFIAGFSVVLSAPANAATLPSGVTQLNLDAACQAEPAYASKANLKKYGIKKADIRAVLINPFGAYQYACGARYVRKAEMGWLSFGPGTLGLDQDCRRLTHNAKASAVAPNQDLRLWYCAKPGAQAPFTATPQPGDGEQIADFIDGCRSQYAYASHKALWKRYGITTIKQISAVSFGSFGANSIRCVKLTYGPDDTSTIVRLGAGTLNVDRQCDRQDGGEAYAPNSKQPLYFCRAA